MIQACSKRVTVELWCSPTDSNFKVTGYVGVSRVFLA